MPRRDQEGKDFGMRPFYGESNCGNGSLKCSGLRRDLNDSKEFGFFLFERSRDKRDGTIQEKHDWNNFAFLLPGA